MLFGTAFGGPPHPLESCRSRSNVRRQAPFANEDAAAVFQSLTMCSCGRAALRPAFAPSCAPR